MSLSARPLRHALLGAGAALATLGAAAAGAASWSPLAPASHPRSEGTFVVHDGAALHFNGFDARLHIQNSIERYDIAADAWQTVGSTSDSPGFPNALTHQGTVVVDGEAWLIGGRVGTVPGRVIDRVLILDLETYAWREGPTLPVPFAGGGAALVGRRIHAFGGIDAEARCDVTTHLVYDLDDPASGWQDLAGSAPFPSPRNHFSTVVMDGLIYAIGGQIGHDDCAALAQQRVQTPIVHVYDPAANDWTRLADLPWSQSHAEPSTFVHAGRIWLVGGVVQSDRVLTYDAAANAWTWREDLALPSALLAPGARIFHGNRLHLFGGGAPDVFNPRTESWVTDVPGLMHEPAGDAPAEASADDEPVESPEPVETPEPVEVPAPVEAPEPVAEPPPEAPAAPEDVAEPVEAEGDASEEPAEPTDGVDADATDDDEPAVEKIDTVGQDGPFAPVGPIAVADPGVADDGAEASDDVRAPDGADVAVDAPAVEAPAADAETDDEERPFGGAMGWLVALLALRVGTRVAARQATRPAA